MNRILKSINQHNLNNDYIVAIIMETKGSTYRKSGTLMLIDQQLNYWGLISGGCLEGDILLHCKKAFSERQDQTVIYNMKDEQDMLWGMGLGCDGEVSLLLKYLPAKDEHFNFFKALTSLNNGTAQQLIINSHHQINFISHEYKNHYSNVSEHANHSKPLNKSSIKLSIKLKPPHHLLICGGAPDVVPVTAIANQIGWKTTVIDHRQEYASSHKFPLATDVKQLKRSQWKAFDLSRFDSAIIMSHQFEMDQRYLKQLLTSAIRYIGLLGPSNRRDKLLAECDTTFLKHQGRLFGPIGLNIGAGNPEIIALSIISEIQAVSNNKVTAHKSISFCYQDDKR